MLIRRLKQEPEISQHRKTSGPDAPSRPSSTQHLKKSYEFSTSTRQFKREDFLTHITRPPLLRYQSQVRTPQIETNILHQQRCKNAQGIRKQTTSEGLYTMTKGDLSLGSKAGSTYTNRSKRPSTIKRKVKILSFQWEHNDYFTKC